MSYGGELLAAAAGPAVNLLLAAALGLPGRWWEPLYLLAGAQAVLGCFNLLPILPLDGGRMLWLALCWGTDPFLADRVTQAVSLAAAGLLAGLAAIPLLFYGYQGVLGRDIMWLDVAIFQIAVLLGFWVTWAMLRRRALASPVWQVAGAAVLAAVWAAFILWTFAPPDLPLFADPETGLRGIR